jgi:hypothetical protein
MPRFVWILLLILALVLGAVGTGRATRPPGEPLEDLQYRVTLGVWGEVARVHLRLTRVAPDRYRAQFSGAAQGVWKLLSRWLPEQYETEMILEGGRLRPLLFKEEFQSKGRRVSKEYRFDYAQGILEVWRGVDRGELRKSWQAPLKEPLYDPLTLLYNLRLGAFGPLAGGQSLKVGAIPDREPREMVVDVGPETGRGRKVMITVKSQNPGAEGSQFFLFCNGKWVPQEAWFRTLSFAKLSGQLLNPEGEMKDGLMLSSEK